MPEEGLNWLDRAALMTWDEMMRLCKLSIGMGVDKIRITGGEPFVRKGIMPFIADLVKVPGLNQLNITTNGVLTAPCVPELARLGIKSVNLSLDTLDRDRFLAITYRDEFDKVMETMQALLSNGIEVKINAVVMEGRNTDDILPLVQLTRELPVSVRFIEEMPFNGGSHNTSLHWNHVRILQKIQDTFPEITKIPDPQFSTAYNYCIPGHKGTVGIIAAYSRTFCGTCNRIRVTPEGILKTCLYEGGGLNIKDLMRAGAGNDAVAEAISGALAHKAVNGIAAEHDRRAGGVHESMATIGG